MADLGTLLGSLMSGLIRARRMADEQTAALAEYYKENPLLEGLSVPRIRIPELTIDMPMLIENYTMGEEGEIAERAKIINEAEAQLKTTFSKYNIKVKPNFYKIFVDDLDNQLKSLKQKDVPAMKETVFRRVQDAFAGALNKTNTSLETEEKNTIMKALREKVSTVSIAKEQVPSNIVANIKTSDVKESASNANVVRLKITLKEEGLEWAVKSGQSGGLERTLQPE